MESAWVSREVLNSKNEGEPLVWAWHCQWVCVGNGDSGFVYILVELPKAKGRE